MPEPTKKQLHALEKLRKLEPNLAIDWDEATGTPRLLRGLLSPAAPPTALQTMAEASLQAAYAFLEQNADLFRLRDVASDLPQSQVLSDENSTTVRVFQSHGGLLWFPITANQWARAAAFSSLVSQRDVVLRQKLSKSVRSAA